MSAAEPGRINDINVVSVASKSVILSWSALDCRLHHGPTVGYSYELIQFDSLDQTTHEEGNTIIRQITNDTRIELTQLVPFTRYLCTVSFRNSDFDGPKTSVNFSTDEDGLYLLSYIVVICP